MMPLYTANEPPQLGRTHLLGGAFFAHSSALDGIVGTLSGRGEAMTGPAVSGVLAPAGKGVLVANPNMMIAPR
jgi:hypothetical protein